MMEGKTTTHAWKAEAKDDQKTHLPLGKHLCHPSCGPWLRSGRNGGHERDAAQMARRNIWDPHPIWFRDLCQSSKVTSVVLLGVTRCLLRAPLHCDLDFLPIRSN